MEYKLYGNIAGWKLLDISENERDIIDTIEDYMRGYPLGYYLIIQRDNKKNMDIPYKNIMNKEQFMEYKQELENPYQLTKKKKK